MNRVIVRAQQDAPVVAPEIYGHFAEHLGRCIYGGLWVGENAPVDHLRGIRSAAVAALRELQVPVLRWPGGCFADEYHWRDGIGPRAERPSMVNTHWGGVTEDNSFGTHEFLDLCSQIGCMPYICGNLGSGSVQEMSQWVEYCNHPGGSPMAELRARNGRPEPWGVRYWGIGNENWGCGGQMTPEYYANEYRRYATYCKSYADSPVYRIACGPNSADYHWTEVMMREAARRMDGLALHYYTVPKCGPQKLRGSATGFSEDDWYQTLQTTLVMDELVTKHSAIMDRHDPERKVALIVDEWGTWYDVEPGTNPGFLYQQNTMRDALVAALNLNIFNAHARRVRMANIAQTVNVLQAVLLTDETRVVRTPTFHVFEMYKVHQGGRLLGTEVVAPQIVEGENRVPGLHASATLGRDGLINVSVANLHARETCALTIDLAGLVGALPKIGTSTPDATGSFAVVSARTLAGTAIGAMNTFEASDAVVPMALTDYHLDAAHQVRVTVPAHSVSLLQIRLG